MSNYNCSSEYALENIYDETNNFLRTIFISIGVIFTSSCCAICVLAQTLFQNVEREYKLMYGYDSDDEEVFVCNYLEEYNNLEDRDISDFSFKKSYIKENSPDGLICIGYDIDNKSFIYYCNYKSVRYQYLEVVARKFVVENNCKKLLYNTTGEFVKAIDEMKKKSSHNSNNENSVFANFKNNKPDKKPSIDYNLGVIDKEIPVPENSNKYIYKGSIYDFEKMIEEENKNTNKKIDIEEFENIDYNTFKNK